jgi:hypothetical protein
MFFISRTVRNFLAGGKSEWSNYRFAAFMEYQAMVIDPIQCLEIDEITVHDSILQGSAKVALNDLMAKIKPTEMFVFVLYSKIVPGFSVDVMLVDDLKFVPKTLLELDPCSCVSESSDSEFSEQMGEILVNDDGTVEREPDAKPITEGGNSKRAVMGLTLNSTGECKSQGTMSVGAGGSRLYLNPNKPTTTSQHLGKHSAPDQSSGYTGRSKSGHAPGFMLN